MNGCNYGLALIKKQQCSYDGKLYFQRQTSRNSLIILPLVQCFHEEQLVEVLG